MLLAINGRFRSCSLTLIPRDASGTTVRGPPRRVVLRVGSLPYGVIVVVNHGVEVVDSEGEDVVHDR